MDLDSAMAVSASGLEVQRRRMNVIASNLANVNTTKTAGGGPYRRRDLMIRSEPLRQPFKSLLNSTSLPSPSSPPEAPGVRAVRVVEDSRPPRQVYEPHHPDANAEGYVQMPDINAIEEMVNLLSASRAYEANVTAMGLTKAMAQRALEIGR
jgi:flagellar basal-body rod protein FlgC